MTRRINWLCATMAVLINLTGVFGQLPKGVRAFAECEGLGTRYSANEAWPDTLTVTEYYYNQIMSWRDFFENSIPAIVVIESIPDSLDYTWIHPRPFVDEEGGGEPFWAIEEKYMVRQYKKYSRIQSKWANFINDTHQNWENFYKDYLSKHYWGLSPSQIRQIISRIRYDYYEIGPKDYRKYAVRDHYDRLKAYIYNLLNYHANTVQNSLDSILFSTRFAQGVPQTIPQTLSDYMEQLFDIEKKRLIVNRDSTFYNKVKEVQLSFQPRAGFPFWFSNNANNLIYISPAIIRSIIVIALNSNTLTQGFDIEKDRFHEDYFSYEERFIFYDFLFKEKSSNGGMFNYLNRSINNLCNIEVFNTSFFQKLSETLSFIIQHEMAHIYLGRNGIAEQKESKCDCYAMLALGDMTDDLPGGYSESGMFTGPGQFKYGLVNTLLKGCLRNNRSDLWNVSDTNALYRRFKFLDENSGANLTTHDCNLR